MTLEIPSPLKLDYMQMTVQFLGMFPHNKIRYRYKETEPAIWVDSEVAFGTEHY